MSNTPQIRFAGFTDAWEQRKLSEISDKVSKKNQNIVVDEVFTNSAEYGIISQRDYFDKDIANSENIDGYYIVEPNDFVYNPRISTLAPFGPVRRNKLDKSGAMSPLYYVFRTHDVDCGYLEYFFKTNRWHSFMHLNGNSGARSDRFAIRDEVFRDMPITMPQDIEEQKKVGDFFSTLELAITLHQRKCDALQKFKKSMLQKMFPQNGESVPEIRFAGFTDAWEQRKLSEISDKVSKKNQNIVVDEVFTNSAEYGIISQRDYFDKDIANSENIDGYYIVEPNDFVYNPRISTLAPFGPVRRNKLDKSGAMSPLYYVFRTHDVDCGYLEYFFKTNRWHSFMHLNGNSGARSDRFAIRDEVFRDMPITMPQDIEEQKKVGDFFSTLELAITLHQRKLETLQKMKKSLLQKMFV